MLKFKVKFFEGIEVGCCSITKYHDQHSVTSKNCQIEYLMSWFSQCYRSLSLQGKSGETLLFTERSACIYNDLYMEDRLSMILECRNLQIMFVSNCESNCLCATLKTTPHNDSPSIQLGCRLVWVLEPSQLTIRVQLEQVFSPSTHNDSRTYSKFRVTV